MSNQHITEKKGAYFRKRESLIDSINSETTITEWEIKHILRNKDKLMASIQDKLYTIQQDRLWVNDVIEMVSLSSKPLSDISKSFKQSDIGNVYEKYEKKLRERTIEFNLIIETLMIKQEKIERIWGAYLALDEPYYSIINKMYVQNQLYATVEQESGFSRHVFEKYRKEAISLMIRFFRSEKSIVELFEMQERRVNVPKVKKTMQEQSDGQICFTDWLEHTNNKKR